MSTKATIEVNDSRTELFKKTIQTVFKFSGVLSAFDKGLSRGKTNKSVQSKAMLNEIIRCVKSSLPLATRQGISLGKYGATKNAKTGAFFIEYFVVQKAINSLIIFIIYKDLCVRMLALFLRPFRPFKWLCFVTL